ncbi:F-box only protein 9 [Agrilus planipennis]|uniref:F-box only protein 9 n=1 Tax=Agrilus planipennis TaxID=224129 RepID=A0A1W4XQS4_AGRPL|nr:F-box only protein 9 [Agrilus planipennis]XP_018335129.1 F-box only protein 9 [Agrilus planipennis]
MNSLTCSNRDRGSFSSTTDCAEEDEQEDSSSSLDKEEEDNVQQLLTTFREKWKKELEDSSKPFKLTKQPQLNTLENYSGDTETIAKELFLKGIEMEKCGKLYEAIQFYRRAVQLVPDIEFRLDEKSKTKLRETPIRDNDNSIENENIVEDMQSSSDEDEDEIRGDLYAHILRKVGTMKWVCIPKYEPEGIHIRDLPTEIMLYILKWVVSSDLDMRSLEICSRVSRGFFLCSRDSEIWRLACVRTWGLNCGGLTNMYSSWRQMYIERARLNFNGCYISKTTYIRHGENSFQDQYYRPWHMVTYYRYFRFFPEGIVLMLTTADEPAQSVSHLKYRKSKNLGVLSGHYRLKDDRVLIVVQHHTAQIKNRKGRKELIQPDGIAEQISRLELQIKDHKKQRHVQLVWKDYCVFTRRRNGNESNYIIDLVTNRFPPLWFSRVKSYTSETESLLM